MMVHIADCGSISSLSSAARRENFSSHSLIRRSTMSARRMLHVETLESRTTPSLTPVGPEIQVNTVTQQQQWSPSVAASASGQFVTAFTGYDPNGPGTHWGVYFRLFDVNGAPLGDQQLVAETPSLFSSSVSVASNAAGDFVVSWIKVGDVYNNDLWTVNARRFDHNGIPLGPAFLVNPATSTNAIEIDSTMDVNGNLVIAWTDDSTPVNVFARRYSSNGDPVSDPVVIAQENGARYPAVTVAPNGVATVLWYEFWSSPHGLKIQQIDLSGQQLGSQTIVNQNINNGIYRKPDITALSDDSLVVAYAISSGSCFRRLSANGAPISNEISVPFGSAPSLAAAANGHFVFSYSGAQSTIRAREFALDNSPVGSEVIVASDPPFAVRDSSIALDADGDGFVAWANGAADGSTTGPGLDGSSFGVFARCLRGDAPTINSAIINNGSPSHSDVKSTSLDFNRQLVLPANQASAFVLTGPMGAIPVSVDTSASTAAGAKLKFTFPTYPNGLPDGRYTLRAIASQIHDTAGQHLDGNGDGVPGDDYVMSFHRLLGDFNGDGAVGANDFALFRLAIGTNNLIYDLDGDGTVDANDFFLFRMQFNTSV
jgi:hypothetical protein